MMAKIKKVNQQHLIIQLMKEGKVEAEDEDVVVGAEIEVVVNHFSINSNSKRKTIKNKFTIKMILHMI
jgi:hypothetical protein